MQHYYVCHYLKAKCTKFDFRMGCTPDPLAVGLFKGPVSNLTKGEGREMGKDGEGGAREKCEA